MNLYTMLQLDGLDSSDVLCEPSDAVRAQKAIALLRRHAYFAVATVFAGSRRDAYDMAQNDHPTDAERGWVRSVSVEQWADSGYSAVQGHLMLERSGHKMQPTVLLIQLSGYTELAYPGIQDDIEAILNTSEERAARRGKQVRP